MTKRLLLVAGNIGAGKTSLTERLAARLGYGDHSSLPGEIGRLLEPFHNGQADLVLGSRVLGQTAAGAMPPHQPVGNWLMSGLMRLLYRVPVTDLGPFRAIRGELLRSLDMREMTVKAARRGARIVEVPVSHHARRAGRSKVSGTVRGSILAALIS